MHKTARLLRKLVIVLIGFPIIVIGLILIPLPGPGILICLLGLFILSFEFDWAKRHADRARGYLRKLLENGKVKR